MSSIGTKIAFYRKAKSLTQDDLANKLGVSAQAVSKWENDIACPDIQLLVPLSKIFNITTDELLSNDTVRSVQLLPEDSRRNIKELTLKVIVDSSEGDKVRVNLPMELVLVALDIGVNIPQLTMNEQMNKIDLNQIISMVERGVIGKLVEIESSEGDTVSVVVE